MPNTPVEVLKAEIAALRDKVSSIQDRNLEADDRYFKQLQSEKSVAEVLVSLKASFEMLNRSQELLQKEILENKNTAKDEARSLKAEVAVMQKNVSDLMKAQEATKSKTNLLYGLTISALTTAGSIAIKMLLGG